MKRIKVVTVLLCLILIYGASASVGKGDDFDKKTVVTINAPVEVPGFDQVKVLAPGTYVFKIMDSSSERNIVEIWNKDETQLITMFIALPDYRLQPPDTTIVTFGENVAGAPVPIREWFYPGENNGWVFVYPRSRALQIAKANNHNVLSTTETSSVPRTLVRGDVRAVTPQGKNADIESAANTKPH